MIRVDLQLPVISQKYFHDNDDMSWRFVFFFYLLNVSVLPYSAGRELLFSGERKNGNGP